MQKSIPIGQLSESNKIVLERLLQYKALRLQPEHDHDYSTFFRFWHTEDVKKWFSSAGYTLYKRVLEPAHYINYSVPASPFAASSEENYPYPYYTAYTTEEAIGPELTACDWTQRIVYAQDSEGRHVVIKATHIETDEYRIFSFLHKQSADTLRVNCILPVLELLHYGKACFVVMPRWGGSINEPHEHFKIRDALGIMCSALKAVSFLHSNYIIHRDLSENNILVNHFGPVTLPHRGPINPYWQTRKQQMAEGQLEYALIDFDLAKILPAHTSREEYKLPFQDSYVGSYFPGDTSQGEFEYNPFAYDVGTLGDMFTYMYGHHSKDVPLLAPFFDRLSTRHVRKRFTAAEALTFLERIISESTEAQLLTPVIPPPYDTATLDRWAELPEDFQREWASYREPTGLPWSVKLLRLFVRCRWFPGGAIVRNTRRLHSRVSALVHRSKAQSKSPMCDA